MIEDIRLIDEAMAALEPLKWPPPLRPTPTRLELGAPTGQGFARGVYVDARREAVHVACYPFPGGDRVPEDRLGAVAEIINLIACTGVPFAVALDLEHGIISMRNGLEFGGVPPDSRVPLLRDLITSVAYSRILYAAPLRRVAFEGVPPARVLGEFERELSRLGPG